MNSHRKQHHFDTHIDEFFKGIQTLFEGYGQSEALPLKLQDSTTHHMNDYRNYLSAQQFVLTEWTFSLGTQSQFAQQFAQQFMPHMNRSDGFSIVGFTLGHSKSCLAIAMHAIEFLQVDSWDSLLPPLRIIGYSQRAD